jgi:DNA-binding transcriptional MerR regulator
MGREDLENITAVLRKLARLNYIKPGEVPNINLYMDQVTTFMDEHLSDSKRHDYDKILTKTMINNYTKNDLLPPPVKKKYSRDHIYVLAFIYYFKNILSISDIQKLINPLTEHFFENEDKPDMERIYSDIHDMCKSQLSGLSKDVLRKSELAKDSFSYVEDDDEREFLELFSLVSLLSFDVYLKKNIIESLIDAYTEKHPTPDTSHGKGKKEK